MISEKAHRRWAGFFALAGVATSLVGLLFSVGLLVAPASIVAPTSGDRVAQWAWVAPAATLVIAGLTLLQVVRGRPVLWFGWLRSESFNWRGRKRYQLVVAFSALSVLWLPFAWHVLQRAASATGPQARAAEWMTAAMAFALEAVLLSTVGFVLFHGWWKRQASSAATARTCRECGYSLHGLKGRAVCPECGWNVSR